MGRLEWNRQVERDRNVLERILALLLALAALTDRAAGLPAAKRLHLLTALASGEAEARDFIIAMASDACPVTPVDTVAPHPPVAGDSTLLAARFRMLALALGAVLAQARAPCRHAHHQPDCRGANRVIRRKAPPHRFGLGPDPPLPCREGPSHMTFHPHRWE